MYITARTYFMKTQKLFLLSSALSVLVFSFVAVGVVKAAHTPPVGIGDPCTIDATHTPTYPGPHGDCAAFDTNSPPITRCVKVGNDNTARCVPDADEIAIGTWCSEVAHCDSELGFFEFTCDKDNNVCVGAGHDIDCSDNAVNTNALLGETTVSRGNRCDRALNCILDANQNGECRRDIGTEFVQDIGVGGSTDDIRDQIRTLINIALGFLGVAGVIIVIYGGALWMTSAGDEEKVEKGKKTIVAGLIGLVIIGIAWTIVSYILNVTQGISG
jgi:hypothetical protein